MKKRRGQKENGKDKDDLLNIRTEKKRKKVQKRKLEKRQKVRIARKKK